MSMITVPAKDGGDFQAYMAVPEAVKNGEKAPAIIVIQEIFGINGVMREKCEWLASKGYIAICPDLFWRTEPGIELTDKTDEEWARAFELFQVFDVDKGIEDIKATKHTMRGHADCTGKVGALGYCLGGKLAYLTSTRSDIDVSVGYYGVGLGELTDEASTINAPLMLHIAEEDEYVSKDEQKIIRDKLGDNQFITLHSYEGQDHAFSRPGGAHYNKEAAELADNRTLEFLKKNLG